MIMRDADLNEFAEFIHSENKKIIVFGYGVVCKVTLPYYLEQLSLSESVICIVDNDCNKQGEKLSVSGNDIGVRPTDIIKEYPDAVILISGSRPEGIISFLESIDIPNQIFLFPKMLTYICKGKKAEEVIRKSDNQLIPKKIHYCWFGGNPVPDKLKRCMDTWNRFCPDYEIIEWSEKNYDVMKYPFTREAYAHKKWAFIPDIARLEILYENGGIYLDTDIELVRSLDELLFQKGYVGIEKWGVINIGGGCGVIPGHPMIKQLLDRRISNSFIREDGSLNMESSGSYETLPFIEAGFKPNNTTQTVCDMTIYGSDYFHPYDYMTGNLDMTPNTYSIHRFSESWVDRKK